MVLRWDIQKGVITIPRSAKPYEIRENAQIFDFELSPDDMSAIDSLNRNKKIFPYYDRIPFYVKALINNRRKIPIITELIKATIHKTKNRLKTSVNGKSQEIFQKQKTATMKKQVQ